MWIARDKNEDLTLFSKKPTLSKGGVWRITNAPAYFYDNGWKAGYTILDSAAFPEITFENSPKELVIK